MFTEIMQYEKLKISSQSTFKQGVLTQIQKYENDHILVERA